VMQVHAGAGKAARRMVLTADRNEQRWRRQLWRADSAPHRLYISLSVHNPGRLSALLQRYHT
jgi:hypothetical protein